MQRLNRLLRPTSIALAAAMLAGVSAWAVSARGNEPAARPADAPAGAAQLASVQVTRAGGAETAAYDGVVEAVRQTAIASQVPGAVVALNVKAGDRVKAGQVLLRLDARAAEQTAAAGAAQVGAARAAQEAATRDFERQKQLFEKNYISRGAFERAEAQYKATTAQAQAQVASAGAARTQSDFYVVKAPYNGVVANVTVVLGDMAMPGSPLLTVYDPGAMRVTADIPQTVAARLAKDAAPTAELPGVSKELIKPTRSQLLPTVDPATHTMELRLDLPANLGGIAPGMFARAWVPLQGAADERLYVPAQAVLRRAELTGVYVIGADGRPLLRQVRLGRKAGDRVEVLSGIAEGDRIALDPQAAARVR